MHLGCSATCVQSFLWLTFTDFIQGGNMFNMLFQWCSAVVLNQWFLSGGKKKPTKQKKDLKAFLFTTSHVLSLRCADQNLGVGRSCLLPAKYPAPSSFGSRTGITPAPGSFHEMSHEKKKLLLSIDFWLGNRDPYNLLIMVYYYPYITG